MKIIGSIEKELVVSKMPKWFVYCICYYIDITLYVRLKIGFFLDKNINSKMVNVLP